MVVDSQNTTRGSFSHIHRLWDMRRCDFFVGLTFGIVNHLMYLTQAKLMHTKKMISTDYIMQTCFAFKTYNYMVYHQDETTIMAAMQHAEQRVIVICDSVVIGYFKFWRWSQNTQSMCASPHVCLSVVNATFKDIPAIWRQPVNNPVWTRQSSV